MPDILRWINVLRKNMARLFLVALIGHHLCTLISSNRISWIFWVPLSTEMKQTSRLNTTCVESIFQAVAQWKYQFTQSSLTSPSKYVVDFVNNTFLYKEKAPFWGNGIKFVRRKSVCCFQVKREFSDFHTLTRLRGWSCSLLFLFVEWEVRQRLT
jgi:hypothetical protein